MKSIVGGVGVLVERQQRKRRRGPMPKPSSECRVRRVSVYLTAAEFAFLTKQAGARERVARWLRDAGMRRRTPARVPQPNIEAWSALARTTANLNQLAKAVNEGKATGVSASILDKLRQQVEALRLSLLGGRGQDEEGEL